MSGIFRNTKTLLLLIAILLVSNISLLLYFLVFNKHEKIENRGRPREAIVDFMKKEIGFNEEQSNQFKKLHEAHVDSMKLLSENVRKAKLEYFGLLRQEKITDSAIRAAAARLSMDQAAFESHNFYHFREVRSLCNDSQKVKLDTMVNRMINRPQWRRGRGNERENKPGQ